MVPAKGWTPGNYPRCQNQQLRAIPGCGPFSSFGASTSHTSNLGVGQSTHFWDDVEPYMEQERPPSIPQPPPFHTQVHRVQQLLDLPLWWGWLWNGQSAAPAPLKAPHHLGSGWTDQHRGYRSDWLDALSPQPGDDSQPLFWAPRADLLGPTPGRHHGKWPKRLRGSGRGRQAAPPQVRRNRRLCRTVGDG